MTRRPSASAPAISPVLPTTNDTGDEADGRGEDEAAARNGDAQDQEAVDGDREPHEHDDDNVQPHRPLSSPAAPSAAERDEHDISHLQYRSWCSGCVEGFGRERGHHATGAMAARLVPLISLDYLFVNKSGVHRRNELNDEEKESALKVLVVYDSYSGSVFFHPIRQKGADEDIYA